VFTECDNTAAAGELMTMRR